MTGPYSRRSPHHQDWLAAEADRLLSFAESAAVPSRGFAWLDGTGAVSDRPPELWITARMTHIFSLAHLWERAGAAALADHGISALLGAFRDSEYDGWYAVAGDLDALNTRKEAYGHAFVILAAASATIADRPDARRLLDAALAVLDQRFWLSDHGLVRESWDRTWRTEEAYRGGNANMHMTEALMAASAATGDQRWSRRALGIADRMVNHHARAAGWRVPEHFDESWSIVPDYNRERPRDPFRPYGVLPGHALEWSRLALALHSAVDDPPDWLIGASRGLFATAVADGWSGSLGGFPYTTDWTGTPVVENRFHWVIAEAIGAAAVLAESTADAAYDEWYERFWEYAVDRHVDHRGGSWHHELTAEGAVSTETWQGKPDVYHALQATLIPRLPLTASLATGVAHRPRSLTGRRSVPSRQRPGT